MDREALHAILPHREPMLLIDEVEVTPEGKAIGKVRVRGDEFFLRGHFPDNPVVPGVILCEMMAQTCCALFGEAGGIPYFTGIQEAVFKRKVTPGNVVIFVCEVTRRMGSYYRAHGEGSVDGERCVRADFSCMLAKEE